MSGRRVTCFLPLSRPDRVEFVCRQVLGLDVEGIDLDVVFVVDNSDIDVGLVCSLLGVLVSGYGSTGLSGDVGTDMSVRRQRICDVFSLGAGLVSGDAEVVFVLEDDTVIGSDFLVRLLASYDRIDNVGVVSGVQCGRHGFRIVGGWNVDDRMSPSKIESVVPKDLEGGLEYVCAAGFFCCVVGGGLFRDAEFSHGLLGPDFYFGLGLFQSGFTNVIDWSLRCDHLTDTIVLGVGAADSVVRFDLVDGYWVRNQDEDPRDRCVRLRRR